MARYFTILCVNIFTSHRRVKISRASRAPMEYQNTCCIVAFLDSTNLCSVDNGGCSHLCLLAVSGSTCNCPTGLELDDDNINCEGGEVPHNPKQYPICVVSMHHG